MRHGTSLVLGALALLVAGCGGGTAESGDPAASDDAGFDSEGGTVDVGADVAADAGDSGDSGDSGDADLDAGPTTKGATALATVTGGQSMKSTSYQLVMTVGQAPGGNVVMRSSTYQVRAGLVGATQP